MGFIHNNTDYL